MIMQHILFMPSYFYNSSLFFLYMLNYKVIYIMCAVLAGELYHNIPQDFFQFPQWFCIVHIYLHSD